jgi:3'-phosphoadenosine 5'-phosphosulfate sulfotransferase (PAPS reductase)/FAD synthetase
MYRTALIKVMPPVERTHLDQLENQSIFIFREAYHAFKNIAMPWSMGKDSNVLIWLARKSFYGKIPFHHCISTRPANFLKCWNSGIGQSSITILT